MWRKLGGTAIVVSQLRQGRRVPFLPRPQIEAIRDARIRSAVVYAARHVPYDHELCRGLVLDPRSIRGATERRPVAPRGQELVREDPWQVLSESIRPSAYDLASTSRRHVGRASLRIVDTLGAFDGDADLV